MTTKFSFWAYGILAVAAFAMFLYTTTSLAGRADVGGPLLNVAILIVVTFIIYMFARLIARKF